MVGEGKPYDASAEIIQEGFLEEVGAWECFNKGEKGSLANLRLKRRLSTGKTKLISCLNARDCELCVPSLWVVCAIVQITYGPPENCGLCCPGWGTATAALSLGRRQPKPDKESRQK